MLSRLFSINSDCNAVQISAETILAKLYLKRKQFRQNCLCRYLYSIAMGVQISAQPYKYMWQHCAAKYYKFQGTLPLPLKKWYSLASLGLKFAQFLMSSMKVLIMTMMTCLQFINDQIRYHVKIELGNQLWRVFTIHTHFILLLVC